MTYRLWGNRGSARYLGMQVMSGMASSFNALVDEFELGPDGDFEIILSADPHEGNWIPLDEGRPCWWSAISSTTGSTSPAPLSIEPLSDPRRRRSPRQLPEAPWLAR